MREVLRRTGNYRWPRRFALVASIACLLGAATSTAASASQVPVWPSATRLALPANAATAAGAQFASLNGVACTSVGNCVGVGSYYDMGGAQDSQAMVATESSGSWGQASEITLPGNARGSAQNAGFNSVTCTSVGNCVAVGQYTDTAGNHEAMVATQTGGGAWTAIQLALPGNANTSAGAQDASLSTVTCTSSGNCVAGGYYTDANGTGDYQSMVATQTGGGAWTAIQLTLPANAATAAGAQQTIVRSVSCTSQGNCVAAGFYTDTNGPGDEQAMVSEETSGTWGQASEVALPAGATTAASGQNAALRSVACTSQGNCVAVGHYADTVSGGSVDEQAMATTETNGTWGQATKLVLPTNANLTAGHQDASIDSVTCTSAGNCETGGYYTDTNGAHDTQALDASETNGVWSQASQLPVPSDAATAPGAQNASFKSVICTSPGNCVAVGHYIDTNGAGDTQAMVLSSVSTTGAPQLVVSTSSLASAVVGTAYHAQLAATGGAGSYTWSITSGALPPGLSLNASTGAISGTPSAAGTSHFTVAVSDLGPPPQQVSTALSIVVAPKSSPPPRSGNTTVATTATVGNQQITLTTPSPTACTANTTKLSVTFNSTINHHSHGAKLKFASVAFFVDRGVKHTRHKTVTRNGKKKQVRVTVYLANATAHKAPVTVALSLRGLTSGNHKLRVVASYRRKVKTHGHTKTVTVTKTLTVHFTVC